MQGRAGTTIDEESYRFFNQQELDAILREGSKQGRNGSRAAIERILRHEPQLERADLWKRIRKLKDPPRTPGRRRIPWSAEDDQLLRSGYESRSSKEKREVIRELLKRHPDWPPSTIWKRARRLGLTLQNSTRRKQGRRRRWSKVNDRQLLNLAGELKASAIATILHRSERAVRCRLAWLGERARVHSDGYARRSLAEELHLGRRTVQRFIVEGLLEVRDPRITRQSIAELKSSGIRLQNAQCYGYGASTRRIFTSTRTALSRETVLGQGGCKVERELGDGREAARAWYLETMRSPDHGSVLHQLLSKLWSFDSERISEPGNAGVAPKFHAAQSRGRQGCREAPGAGTRARAGCEKMR